MIRNKLESDFTIKKLGLNKMLEGIFSRGNTEELEQFLNSHPYPYYNLRDKSASGGKFLYKATSEEILEKSENYQVFSVYESLALADEKLILQGDILVNEDFSLTACLSDIKGISNRIAMGNPVYHLTDLDLKERREPSIGGLTEVINYIVEHELFGMVVEFSLFDIPVGINHENIIIWELRNY